MEGAGGFVNKNESIDSVAANVVREVRELNDFYIEQLYCTGDLSRDSQPRMISIAYWAVINLATYKDKFTSRKCSGYH